MSDGYASKEIACPSKKKPSGVGDGVTSASSDLRPHIGPPGKTQGLSTAPYRGLAGEGKVHCFNRWIDGWMDGLDR